MPRGNPSSWRMSRRISSEGEREDFMLDNEMRIK